MYASPPLTIKVNSAAHVVGTRTTTILAAPGATTAYRIVACHVYINRTSAAAIVDQFVYSGTSSMAILALSGMSIAGVPGGGFDIPEPGYQLPPNESLLCDSISSAANGLTTIFVAYYLDVMT